MYGKRTAVNVVVFLIVSGLLVFLGATQLVFSRGGGRTLSMDFSDTSGLAPRNDVTMRGVPVGAVKSVALTRRGLARVTVILQPGVTVPAGTKAEISRRSAIGDITLNLTPGTGPPLRDGAHLALADTVSPPDAEKTIMELARVLHAVPSKDLSSLVSELATAVRGRGDDLATLSTATANLPERILAVRTELTSLIVNGPKVMDVLAANAQPLADDISQTAGLADILRNRRYDLVKLMENGASFAQVANNLVAGEKPNISCLVTDFGSVNATLAQPANLKNLQSALDLNHFFFDAVWVAVQPGTQNLDWFRVQLLPPQQPAAAAYNPHRPPPDVFPGSACTNRFGHGVGPVLQVGRFYLAPGSKLHLGV